MPAPLDVDPETGFKFAIVPAAGGYVGLMCVEMPEVWFEDLITLDNADQAAQIRRPIDPVYLETVAPGTLRVTSILGDQPCLFGARIDTDDLVVDLVPERGAAIPAVVQVRISGIRKGAEGIRFPQFTEREAAANREFWQAWRES